MQASLFRYIDVHWDIVPFNLVDFGSLNLVLITHVTHTRTIIDMKCSLGSKSMGRIPVVQGESFTAFDIVYTVQEISRHDNLLAVEVECKPFRRSTRTILPKALLTGVYFLWLLPTRVRL